MFKGFGRSLATASPGQELPPARSTPCSAHAPANQSEGAAGGRAWREACPTRTVPCSPQAEMDQSDRRRVLPSLPASPGPGLCTPLPGLPGTVWRAMASVGSTALQGAEEGTFLYFAYGSNLLRQRIHLRNPSAQFCCVARLQVSAGPGPQPRNCTWAGHMQGKCPNCRTTVLAPSFLVFGFVLGVIPVFAFPEVRPGREEPRGAPSRPSWAPRCTPVPQRGASPACSGRPYSAPPHSVTVSGQIDKVCFLLLSLLFATAELRLI